MFRTLKNQEGFTLIELVIIIILIGVLAAIAIPRYVDLRNNAVEAAAKATLDAGRAAVSLDFADKVLNAGAYSNLLSNTSATAELAAQDVTNLEAELQSTPNYPPSGGYDTPGASPGRGFRWWLIGDGQDSPAVPPVIDGTIDATCSTTNSQSSTQDQDCWVSKL